MSLPHFTTKIFGAQSRYDNGFLFLSLRSREQRFWGWTGGGVRNWRRSRQFLTPPYNQRLACHSDRREENKAIYRTPMIFNLELHESKTKCGNISEKHIHQP